MDWEPASAVYFHTSMYWSISEINVCTRDSVVKHGKKVRQEQAKNRQYNACKIIDWTSTLHCASCVYLIKFKLSLTG